MEAPEVYELRKIRDHDGVKYVTIPPLFLETLARIWHMDFVEACQSEVIWSVTSEGKAVVEIVKIKRKS